MQQDLVSIVSCGCCGAETGTSQICPNCGQSTQARSLPVVYQATLGTGVSPAPSNTAVGSVLIDFLLILLSSAGAGAGLYGLALWWGSSTQLGWLILGSLLGFLVSLLGCYASYRNRGNWFGGLLFGVRYVDPVCFLPSLPWQKPVKPIAVSLKLGRDPLLPCLVRWRFETGDAPVDLPVAKAVIPAGIPAGAGVLLFDTGQVYWFANDCVIGRSPVGATSRVSLPDMSRKLSGSHLLLRISANQKVIVQDLGSETGSWLIQGGEEVRLGQQDTEVGPQDLIRIGDYTFNAVVNVQ